MSKGYETSGKMSTKFDSRLLQNYKRLIGSRERSEKYF